MPCVCGSFQCACQEKCFCCADDCHCKRCDEIRRISFEAYGSGAKGSPTRGATALLTKLRISGGQSTRSSNYPNPNLLFPGRISHARSLSSSSQHSAQEICTQSSPESLKKRSPKRKHTPTKEELSALVIKRPSPCKNESNAPSRTNQSANVPKSPTSDSSTSQDASPIHCLRKSLSMSDISCTSFESKYLETTQKNIRASTESIYERCLSSAGSSAAKKLFSPSKSIKNIGKFKLKSASYQKYVRKSKFSGKGKSISGQSISGLSLSKWMPTEFSEVAQPSSSTGSCHEASASASPKSNEQSIVKGGTSNPLKSQQAFPRQKPLASKKPVSLTATVDIPQRFTGTNTLVEMYENLSQRWIADDDRSHFAPYGSYSAASSARESADNVNNPERNYQRSDSEVSNNSENQVVPDIG